MYDVYGVPKKPSGADDAKYKDEHYWSEYRRNYELNLKRKMEEDRKRMQYGGNQ